MRESALPLSALSYAAWSFYFVTLLTKNTKKGGRRTDAPLLLVFLFFYMCQCVFTLPPLIGLRAPAPGVLPDGTRSSDVSVGHSTCLRPQTLFLHIRTFLD